MEELELCYELMVGLGLSDPFLNPRAAWARL